jgi:hypothetical protein
MPLRRRHIQCGRRTSDEGGELQRLYSPLVIPSFCGLLAWRKERIRKGQNLVETNPGGPSPVRLLLSG